MSILSGARQSHLRRKSILLGILFFVFSLNSLLPLSNGRFSANLLFLLLFNFLQKALWVVSTRADCRSNAVADARGLQVLGHLAFVCSAEEVLACPSFGGPVAVAVPEI